MRLEIASGKAVEYACKNFHYAKRTPTATAVAFSVFNKNKEWCGCICYGYPSGGQIIKTYNLYQGNIFELQRVALNGKQELTSQAVAISIKLVRKKFPLVKMLVSYADKGQEHYGIIYQATNWIYIDESNSSSIEYFKNGVWVHSTSLKTNNERKKYKNRRTSGKRKYIYCFDSELKNKCEKLKKPYPKKSVKNIESDVTPFQEEEGGAIPTLTHQ